MTATSSVDQFAYPAGPNASDRYRGFTTREYLASAAMQAILQSLNIQGEIEPDFTFVAEQAFNLADAMLKRGAQ